MDQLDSSSFLTDRIGKPVRRVDAVAKAGGYARYAADLDIAGMLYGRLVRSRVSRAVLTGVSVPELPDGYYFISSKDITKGGINRLRMIFDDWKVFAEGEIRFKGETVGMLVGPDRGVLVQLERSITIESTPLEPALTIEDGLACKGGPIIGQDNLFTRYDLQKGDPDAYFSGSFRIVEEEIRTGFQEHAYMEPQSMVGYMENGKYCIKASCQCPFYIRKSVAGVLNVPQEDIIVTQAVTGGAFGGKEHFPDVIAGPLLVAVQKIGRPIQVVFDRREDISFTAKRHPSRVKFRTAVDTDGSVLAMEADIAINAGGYQSCSHIVLQRAMFSINSVYNIPNVRVTGRAVCTNAFPSDAFRGFGAPQGIFACEMHMSHIAREIGIDEAEFKLRHSIEKGGKTVTNGTIHEEVKIPEMLKALKAASDYDRKNSEYGDGQGRGLGLSFYNHGGGFTGDGEKQIIKALVKLARTGEGPDRKVAIKLSNVEMGQGFETTCSKVAAKVLGIPLEQVDFAVPDTSCVPNSGPTVASRSMMVVGKLVERAATKMQAIWDNPGNIETEARYVQPEGIEWDREKLQGDAYPAYGWGICAVEVEVDPLTYEIETKGIWTIHDIGVPIDDLIVHGQVHGGVIQSLGYGSLENLELKDDGGFSQNTFADYIIPTTMDFPSVQSELIENPYDNGPFGAKGMGELVFDGAAAAYAAAVQKAIGRKVNKIPVNPEYILQLKERDA